jgi:hypothetical protein
VKAPGGWLILWQSCALSDIHRTQAMVILFRLFLRATPRHFLDAYPGTMALLGRVSLFETVVCVAGLLSATVKIYSPRVIPRSEVSSLCPLV